MKTGMLKAMRLCAKYRKMGFNERLRLQDERLRQVVSHARENSPYYRRLYAGISPDFGLRDLPPVNKVDLMAHFDEWLTDRSVTLEAINRFMEDPDNIGRKLNGKYLVFTTSGSTGNPSVVLCDKTANNVMGAVNAVRSFARSSDLKAFMLRGGKTVGVFATGGFYLGNSSVRSRILAMPWKRRQMAVTSALLPIEQIVAELNQFQPAMLGGYPTILELLIDEQTSGRLRIRPVLIMTGGELLSDELRTRLSEAFGCYVQTSYSCTEGGTIACECVEKHFHVNDDWVVVEPVDRDNRPVSDGVQSDRILLTNLFNYTQPFIRYEITDRVVMHHEPCGCGNPSPWLTLEGRTDDILTFEENGKRIRIAPLALYAILKEIHEIRRFQVVAYCGNRLELRLVPVEGYGRDQVFLTACQRLRDFLGQHGVTQVDFTLSQEEPRQHPGSGKFKHIINTC
ncbi:MAG TPA: AMP-binding protein [Thermoclostridium sp.]|nr:AMP-binding protein [Thermoclostridium sp.]